jgi:hypothetical protein
MRCSDRPITLEVIDRSRRPRDVGCVEAIIKLAWLALAAVHVMPAAVLVRPDLMTRLYGLSPVDPAGVLLVHRGALFAAVLAATLFALIDPAARRVASLVTAISVAGFLIVYLRAGAPAGPLRGIALVDAAALLPLGVVTVAAWRG